MKTPDITDPPFRTAVEALDAGDLPGLRRVLEENAGLVGRRLDQPAEGYFRHPFLLWFVADNPIRHGKLPTNMGELARLLVEKVKAEALETAPFQLDYALGLVVTGSTPRDSGVQLELMDLLIDAGAVPGTGHGALASGNLEAAAHLLERGGELTLATAVILERWEEVTGLSEFAEAAERETALVAAAFYGKAESLRYLIGLGVDVNAFPSPASGFHHHATALHQAVSSGSLEAVKVLVEAGADVSLVDRIHGGTPFGWAMHMQSEAADEVTGKQYAEIVDYLRALPG
ncbi:MAG: ankyrin repeat domain-containing protein [Verrucomicrobiota bacterium]